ncbi:MAG TPA: AAA family ATPase [Kofleriaceae bacterium]|jgi:DNA-binding transcriptional regulator GbsR (MarR family)|nr:AAA family ATPase [Kofleriaceae bacterium]
MTHASGPLLFNPARASFNELEQTFVGRRALLDQLEADLLADAKGKTARHWQLIGPRGTGKSHFTELLGHRLRGRGWAVVRLPEDHYQVASVGELLEQIVVRLDHLELSPFRDTASARDVEEQGLDYLRGWRKQHAEPILVILENLGLLFERQLTSVREQSRLREILMRDAPFVLLTTSTSYLESTGRHAAPFYDFFHVHTLDELSRTEVVNLVEARARWDQEEALLRDYGSVKARLDALYHLSGGNPRLGLALYSIIRQGITSELHHQLLKLLDDVTPYYQARLRDITPQMERVLIEMALAEGPLTPSELARRCRMATNQVTANVTKLVAERLVSPGSRPDARRRYYQVSDRLFRIWLQMREDTTAKQKLKFLIEFFQSWYRDSIDVLKKDVDRLGDAFWSELRQGLSRQCDDRLLTLDYMRAAVPEYPADLILQSLRNSSERPTGAAVEEQVRLLKPLYDSTTDPNRRLVIGYLLAVAHDRGGDSRRALSLLKELVDEEAGVPTFSEVWKLYLHTLAEIEGPKAALRAGAKAVTANPKLFELKSRLACWSAELGRAEDAFRLAEEFIATSTCPGCKTRITTQLVLSFLGEGKVRNAERALGLATWSGTDRELAVLKMLILRRKEGEQAPLLSDLQDALSLYDQEQALPYWLLWNAACRLSHAPSQEARAASLLKEVARRDGHLDSATLSHTLEVLIRMASADARPLAELVSWLVANGSPQQIREHFVSEMPGLIRRTGMSGALRLYRELRNAGILPPDLAPYSTAEVVEASPEPTKVLESLHPEVREAVSLLLPRISGVEDAGALRSTGKGSVGAAQAQRTPDGPPPGARTGRGRAARVHPAESRRRTGR